MATWFSIQFSVVFNRVLDEVVFRLNRPTSGVILLRTLATDPVKRFELIKDILDKAEGKFIVVREYRIRIREL